MDDALLVSDRMEERDMIT
jgi:pentatricopeptide repeat protein